MGGPAQQAAAKSTLPIPQNGPLPGGMTYQDMQGFKNPFGGGNVAGNLGYDEGIAQDNPVGHVANDAWWGVPGALATSAQGGNGFSNTPFQDAAGAPDSPATAAGQTADTPMPGTPGLNTTATPANGLDTWAKMNPTTLSQRPGYTGDAMNGGLQVNKDALRAYQNYALDKGPSPWLSMQRQQNATMRGQAEDAAVQNAATGQQQAGDFAASHGGLTGGGAARSAQLAQLGEANGMQGARFNESNQNLNAGMFEEQQKLGAQAALPGMQENLAKYNAGNEMFDVNALNNANAMNAGNYIGGINQGNQNTLTKYGIDANTAAASNMSNAMLKSGKHK